MATVSIQLPTTISSISSTTSDVWARDYVGDAKSSSMTASTIDRTIFDKVSANLDNNNNKENHTMMSSYDIVSNFINAVPSNTPTEQTPSSSSSSSTSISFGETPRTNTVGDHRTHSFDVVDELLASFPTSAIENGDDWGLADLFNGGDRPSTDSDNDDSSYEPSSSSSSEADTDTDDESTPGLLADDHLPPLCTSAEQTMPSIGVDDILSPLFNGNKFVHQQHQPQPMTVASSSSSSSTTTKAAYIRKNEINMYKDILCVRGGEGNNNPGNKMYLLEIRNARPAYKLLNERTEKKKKKQISLGIVNKIKNNGGRFLRKDKHNSDIWYELGHTATFRKVSQALRDETPEEKILRKEQEAGALSVSSSSSSRTSNSKKRKANTTTQSSRLPVRKRIQRNNNNNNNNNNIKTWAV